LEEKNLKVSLLREYYRFSERESPLFQVPYDVGFATLVCGNLN